MQTRERASSLLTLPTIVTAFTRMEKRKKKKNESIENYCKQLTISQVSRCAKSVIHELITSQNLSTTIVTVHSSVCFFVGRNVRKRVYDGQSGIGCEIGRTIEIYVSGCENWDKFDKIGVVRNNGIGALWSYVIVLSLNTVWIPISFWGLIVFRV